jgi:hypothetical protein
MVSNSKHYGDVRLWIIKIIDSCQTPQQLNVASKLVRNFMENVEADRWLKYDIERELDNLIHLKKIKLIK